MTDFEKFKELLDSWQVGYRLETQSLDNVQVIILEAGENKIDGYCMFVTNVEFDMEGKFLKFGIWE